MAALPTDPAPVRPFTSPVTAAVKLVTNGDTRRRWAPVGRALAKLGWWLHGAYLILIGIAAVAYGVWLIYPPAGFITAGLGLLLMEQLREDKPTRAAGSGSP